MIVDFHVHIAVESQGMWTPEVWSLLREHYPDKAEDIKRYERDPGRFRHYLESQGLDLCVLLAEDSSQTGLVPNDYILEFARQEPDFFIPFLALNPNKTGAFESAPERFRDNVSLACQELEWLAGQGFRGIKDYSSYNHLPLGAEVMLPFYERAAALGLPVLFHTGESFFDSEASKTFASPAGLERLAHALPQLPLIIGHAGGGKYFATAYRLAAGHPNVYLELSAVPPQRLQTHFFDRGMDLNALSHKLVFGSDYPALPRGRNGIRKNIEAYRELAAAGVLSAEALDGLLGRNALRLLGPRPSPRD